MKRTILLLAVLAAAIGFWWFSESSEKTKMETLSAERTFKVDNVKDIHRMVIQNANGDFDIRKTKEGWLVNDTVELWSPQLRQLYLAFGSLEVNYAPSKALLSTMQKSFKDHPIVARAYDKKGNELIGFILGGVTPDEKGTYAKRLDADNPFVIHIPGLQGNIRKRFSYKMKDLENRFFFEEEWDDINEVTVEYPRGFRTPFSLQKNGRSYEVQKLKSEGKADPLKIKKGRAEAYLMHFERLGFEAFENQHKQKDSITALVPFATITMKKDDGETKWMKLYPFNDNVENIDLSDTYLGQGKFFRYLAHTHKDDLILIQDGTIGKTLEQYETFLPKK